MAQSSLVGMQIDDGARIVERLRETGFDVAAAWWMKASEEGLWFLYIGSKEVEEKGILDGYRAVLAVIGGLGQLWVDRFEVKLVGAENPITKDVVGILNRYHGRTPTRYGGGRLGNVSIEEAYLYPQPVTT
jgi:hypothetical protein